MKEKEIKRFAKKLKKELKGNVDFVSIEEHLKTLGYTVIFFNTPVGDKEIIRYSLMSKAEKAEAFTYSSAAKIVFINNNCSGEEKLYLLCHEAGHITLGHMNYSRLSTHNKVLLDIEADVFAHNIIHPSKQNHTVIALMVLIVVLAVVNFVSAPQTTKSTTVTTQTEYVCVTSNGEKYHRENCIHTKDKDCTKLTKQEAQKNYTPCLVCNP